MKNNIDSKIQTLITNAFKSNQRNIFILVGDQSKNQVPNFYYLLSKQFLSTKPNVLWCYKRQLGFSINQKKRIKEGKSVQTQGLYNNNVDDTFQLFIASTDIKYTAYKESHKVLGNTFQMLVLQDFEALTPNILCRTIQTVQGGGMIMILLKAMSSLKQLYSITMDVHQRYRTDKFNNIEPRFNERFILSLSECRNCIFMDDQLNIFPTSSHINQIQQINIQTTINRKAVEQLQKLKKDLQHKEIIGKLIAKAKTLDQAKGLMVFIDSILSKTNKTTISLTAARGRGKSASIGLSVASSIALGYSNIFVTAPSPQNLKTFFEFVVIGLECLGYKQNTHYQKIESANQEYNRSIIRINIFKDHHQFLQYVFPNDSNKISNADLIVIDQAAAIPLPFIKQFLVFPLVFLSSTINGYQGTGRSLSLKLIQEIKEQNRKNGQQLSSTRQLKQITLTDPIRYSLNDPIEKWLYDLLHLDATTAVALKQGIPHPNDCDLYIVNRDSLFSYKKTCQKFLHSLMSLFISSHYKNSPNDLQLLSDSPSQLIFVLLGPLKNNSEGKTQMPDILCAIQLCIQGDVSQQNVLGNIERGMKPSGDLIPWNIRQQFQDNNFPRLSGGRIVRIATHPTVQKMGYGTKSLQQLILFFQNKLINLNDDTELVNYDFKSQTLIKKPLLKKLDQIKPPKLDYLGTSYGVTKNLFKFWKKSKFEPVYIRQTRNDITAEHSCIMIRDLESKDKNINIVYYVQDFKKRFINLLSFEFRQMDISLAVDILSPNLTTKQLDQQNIETVEKEKLKIYITLLDFKRIEAYSKNLADFHLIIDLLPALSKLFFCKQFGALKVSYIQAAILIGLGLQHKTIDLVSKQLNLPVSQCLALFNKTIRKLYNIIKKIFEKQAQELIPRQQYRKIEAIANEEQQIIEAGEKQKQKIYEGNTKKPHSRYNYELKDQDLQKIDNIGPNKLVTIGRKLQDSRNLDYEAKTKKKVKK